MTAASNTTLTVKKTSELNSCNPFPGGIHFERTNVPVNPCEFDFQVNVVNEKILPYIINTHKCLMDVEKRGCWK